MRRGRRSWRSIRCWRARTPGSSTLPFFAAYLLSFEYVKPLAEVLGDTLTAERKILPVLQQHRPAEEISPALGEATFYILPIDEAGVYNEMLELLDLERGALKKLDTAGKHDAVVDTALGFSADYPMLTYEEGVRRWVRCATRAPTARCEKACDTGARNDDSASSFRAFGTAPHRWGTRRGCGAAPRIRRPQRDRHKRVHRRTRRAAGRSVRCRAAPESALRCGSAFPAGQPSDDRMNAW